MQKHEHLWPLSDGLLNEMLEETEAKAVDSGLVELVWFLNSKPVDPEIERLQTEITNDVAPVLTSIGLRDHLPPLRALIDKINGLDLRFKWWIDLAGNLPEAKLALGSGQGTLLLGGERSVVKKYPDYREGKSEPMRVIPAWKFGFLQERYRSAKTLGLAFYGAIIAALENGTFARLGKCKECGEFFIAKRLGQKFCDLQCIKAADKKAAVTRMRVARKTPTRKSVRLTKQERSKIKRNRARWRKMRERIK